MTQEELSEAIGVSVVQLYRYENEKSEPTAPVVSKIADALSVSADYLLALTEDRTPRNFSPHLSTVERRALTLWRQGDKLEAVKVIVETP